MADLNGNTIAATYTGLLKTSDSGARGAEGSADQISDGRGNNTPLYLSATEVYALGSGAGTSHTAFGKDCGVDLSTGTGNALFGEGAGADLTTGEHNTAIGYRAIYQGTTETDDNVAIGYNAMSGGWTTAAVNDCVVIGSGAGAGALVAGASGSTVVGTAAGAAMTSAERSTAVGYKALNILTTGNDNTAIGYEALLGSGSPNDHYSNTAVGAYAGTALESGSSNTFIGMNSGKANTDGYFNTFIGRDAGLAATLGSLNVIIGANAGDLLTTSGNNVLVGVSAGTAIAAGQTTTDGTVAIGSSALAALTTGAENTAVGYQAGAGLTVGGYNIAIGPLALTADTKGSRSVAIGRRTLLAQNFTSPTDAYNVAVGFEAGNDITTGTHNTLIGGLAGDSIADGGDNIVIGYQAGDAMTDAGHNVIIGVAAAASGVNFTTGDECVIIGSGADVHNADAQNEIAIGYDCNGVDSNSVTLGNDSVTAVYMASDKGATVYAAAEYLYNSNAAEVEFIRMYLTNTSSSNGSCAASITAYGDRTSGGGTREVAKIKFAKELQWVADPPGSNDASIGFWGQESETLTEQFHIASNGDLTARDTTIGSISDSRLKENVDDYEGGLDIINQLRPVTFNYINPKQHQSGTRRGFLAQEVQEVDDYWVGEIEIAEFLEDGLEGIEGEQEAKARSKNPDYDLCEDTDYISLTSKLNAKDAMYIGAIKELLEKIETLESKVSALEG